MRNINILYGINLGIIEHINRLHGWRNVWNNINFNINMEMEMEMAMGMEMEMEMEMGMLIDFNNILGNSKYINIGKNYIKIKIWIWWKNIRKRKRDIKDRWIFDYYYYFNFNIHHQINRLVHNT